MRVREWFSYECLTYQHSRCDGEGRQDCDCRCHQIGDDEWWEEEPPYPEDVPP